MRPFPPEENTAAEIGGEFTFRCDSESDADLLLDAVADLLIDIHDQEMKTIDSQASPVAGQ